MQGKRTLLFNPPLFGKKKKIFLHAELKKDLIYVTATLLIPPEVSLISTGVRQIKIHLRVQYLAAVELLLTG